VSSERLHIDGTYMSVIKSVLPKVSTSRLYSSRSYSAPPNRNTEALDKWIASKKQLILKDRLGSEHLSDLYITLPTRDGTRRRYTPPEDGLPLGYGHHLVFFHPRNPEAVLRQDGTDADFCPPEPFTRRMWAGGKMKWHKNPLLIGQKATASSTVGSVEKKGFENGSPMAFVKQKIEIQMQGRSEVSVEEERTHVYLPVGSNQRRSVVREVPINLRPDFSLTYRPSSTTLFRFSALTFNGHHIHLDKDYAQKQEGYPERLVHGPLTALMLLETTMFQNPDAQVKYFEYRARNPQIVNRAVTIYGAWERDCVARLWSVDEEGVIGMTGNIHLYD